MKDKNPVMLIVDDEIDALKTFREVFELRGWSVFTAPMGSIALSIIEKEKVDIALLDIRLPSESGIDLLKEIKSKNPALPVVMVTALGYDDDLVNEALRLGASGYVSKGVPIRELIGAVRNAMTK